MSGGSKGKGWKRKKGSKGKGSKAANYVPLSGGGRYHHCEYDVDGSSGPLYALAFNFRDVRYTSLLAAAGKHGATVFCLKDMPVVMRDEAQAAADRNEMKRYSRTTHKAKTTTKEKSAAEEDAEELGRGKRRIIKSRHVMMGDEENDERDSSVERALKLNGSVDQRRHDKEDANQTGGNDNDRGEANANANANANGGCCGDDDETLKGEKDDEDAYVDVDECDDEGGGNGGEEEPTCWLPSERLEMLMRFEDEDQTEDFYCCTWANGSVFENGNCNSSCNNDNHVLRRETNENNMYGDFENGNIISNNNNNNNNINCDNGDPISHNHPLLILGGFSGIVKVLDVSTGSLVHAFKGHGNSINSLAVIPSQSNVFTRYNSNTSINNNNNNNDNDNAGPTNCSGAQQHYEQGDLILSGSKDESIRMWNLKTKTCVMVFAGAGGHTGEITAVDYNCHTGMLVSGGLDNAVKIWDVKKYHEIISLSHSWQKHPSSFPTLFVQYPIYASSKIHDNYIDSVMWFGNLIFSKSVDDKILLWAIKKKNGESDQLYKNEAEVLVLNVLPFCDASIWFIKFSMDFNLTKLACGNHAGVVHVWSLTSEIPKLICKLTTSNRNRLNKPIPIRQTAVSFDGRIVAACTDDGCVWTWRQTSDKEDKKSIEAMTTIMHNADK